MRDSKNASIFFINGLHIRLAHYIRGNWECASWSNYPVNRLIIVKEAGKGVIRDDKESYTTEAGKSYFVPSNRDVYFGFDENVIFVSIHFTLEHFYGEDVFSHLPNMVVWSQPEDQKKRVNEIFEIPDGLLAYVKLKGLLYEFAAELIPLLPKAVTEVSAKWTEFIALRNLLGRDFSAMVTVDMLAEAMSMRREVFTRRFKQVIGITPKLFMTRLLVRRSMEMLSAHELPVHAVARRLGFNNEFYFSRFFKKHVGVSPVKFKPGLRNLKDSKQA